MAKKLASSQTVAPELKAGLREFKGDRVSAFLTWKHQFRVARTNGKRDLPDVTDCMKSFEVGEVEAEELLGGKFAVELDENALTLKYTYAPSKKD